PPARRDGRAAAPLPPPRDRGDASGARVDPPGTGWRDRHDGRGPSAHTDPGRRPGVNGHRLIPRLAPGVSRVAYGCAHGSAVLALPAPAARCPVDDRDRAAPHDDDRERRVGRRAVAPGTPRGGDGRGGVGRHGSLSVRGGAVAGARRVRRRARLEDGVARLTLERVSFWYPATGRPAVRDVSLGVAPGEVVALVGNVGAGASTLLLVAADLAPRVVGGKIE